MDSIAPDAILVDALGSIVADYRAQIDRDLEQMRASIAALLAELRLAARDIKGERGEKGEPGTPGIAASVELIKALVEVEVMRFGATVPVPKDGKDGRDGVDGKDGRDGFSFEDMEETYDGERTITRVYRRGGEVIHTTTFRLPTSIYRGVFKAGSSYERGDQVSYRGSIWHCREATGEKPDENHAAWILAAKKGQDGRDGKDGAPGPRGADGRAGRDLTHVMPDGTRY